MNALYIMPIFLVVFLTFMLFTLFGGSFVRLFHLVDKRSFLNAESWEKVNVLMANGDFSMYAHEGYEPGKRYNRISIGYTKGKDESVSKTFSGDDINKMVSEAFEWATNEGYLAKPSNEE